MSATQSATAPAQFRYCSKPGCSNRLIHPDSLESGECLSCQGVLNRYYHVVGERGAERPEPPFVDEMRQAAVERANDWRTNPQD